MVIIPTLQMVRLRSREGQELAQGCQEGMQAQAGGPLSSPFQPRQSPAFSAQLSLRSEWVGTVSVLVITTLL